MNYVVGFAFTADRHQLLLIEKRKPKWQIGLLNGIGGKIELDESAHQAMIREFDEETNVLIKGWEIFAKLSDTVDQAVWFFRAFDDAVLSFQQPELEIPTTANPLSLPSNVIDNLIWLIPLALDRAIIVPVLFRQQFIFDQSGIT